MSAPFFSNHIQLHDLQRHVPRRSCTLTSRPERLVGIDWKHMFTSTRPIGSRVIGTTPLLATISPTLLPTNSCDDSPVAMGSKRSKSVRFWQKVRRKILIATINNCTLEEGPSLPNHHSDSTKPLDNEAQKAGSSEVTSTPEAGPLCPEHAPERWFDDGGLQNSKSVPRFIQYSAR